MCLFLRIYLTFSFPFNVWTHFFPTYLRLDALFFGTLISWHYHFNTEWFGVFARRCKRVILFFSLIGLTAPFFFFADTFFMLTAGLTFLYIAFGGILVLQVFNNNTKKRCWLPFAYIGRFSYSIYLIHLLIGPAVANFFKKQIFPAVPPLIYSLVSIVASILFGILISIVVEQFFLRMRDKYFPKLY